MASIVDHSASGIPAPALAGSTLASGAAGCGLSLSAAQLSRFAQYQSELLDWNARMNLTAIVDPTEIELRHFLDSLTVSLAFPRSVRSENAPARLLDIGSGAGFPGVPLAMV